MVPSWCFLCSFCCFCGGVGVGVVIVAVVGGGGSGGADICDGWKKKFGREVGKRQTYILSGAGGFGGGTMGIVEAYCIEEIS